MAPRSAPTATVWVSDWYNYIVQHNPTPKGFKTGKGAAYETPLRDKTHGRIYRISPKVGSPNRRTDHRAASTRPTPERAGRGV